MKKIFLSIILLVLILVNSGLSVFAESTEININDIPLDWEGWYMGYGAHWEVKRGMEMHILTVADDGAITGVVRIYPYVDVNKIYALLNKKMIVQNVDCEIIV